MSLLISLIEKLIFCYAIKNNAVMLFSPVNYFQQIGALEYQMYILFFKLEGEW